MKSGNLNFLEPSGPLQACNGTDLAVSLSVLWTLLAVCRFAYFFYETSETVSVKFCVEVCTVQIFGPEISEERVPSEDWTFVASKCKVGQLLNEASLLYGVSLYFTKGEGVCLSGAISSHVSRYWFEASGQRHASAALLPIPNGYGAVWAPQLLWRNVAGNTFIQTYYKILNWFLSAQLILLYYVDTWLHVATNAWSSSSLFKHTKTRITIPTSVVGSDWCLSVWWYKTHVRKNFKNK